METVGQLKEALEEWLGMEGKMEMNACYEYELTFYSPTGVELFHLTLSEGEMHSGWRVGGGSEMLPGQWDRLMSFGR